MEKTQQETVKNISNFKNILNQELRLALSNEMLNTFDFQKRERKPPENRKTHS